MTTPTVEDLQAEITNLKKSMDVLLQQYEVDKKKEKHLSILVMSNDYDKLVVAMNMAAAAISSGYSVSLMFTFWGITALRKKTKVKTKKDFVEKMFGLLLPSNPEGSVLSQMHFMGIGTWMMKKTMQKQRMPLLGDLVNLAKELDIKLVACSNTLAMLGLKKEELIDGVALMGAASFFGEMRKSSMSWII